MAALFRKNEKELGYDQQQEHAIGRVALPEQGAPVSPDQAPQQPQEQQPVQQEQYPQPQEQQPVQQAEAAPLPSGGQVQQLGDDLQQVAQAVPKSSERKEIEEVLSEGLTEVYQSMTPQEQEAFRKKGEEAASAIEELMHGFKATARRVVAIIRGWLSSIPRVNKYFLEQESKLKTDEILKLQRKLKKKQRSRIDL